jgi:hypothetical protein
MWNWIGWSMISISIGQSSECMWPELRLIPEPSPLLPVPGDYDANGSVDSGDYIVWRATLGDVGVHLAADGNLNGEVDSGDYDVWRAHFGESNVLMEANASLATVPEAATTVLFICALMLLGALRTRYRFVCPS